MTNDRNARSEKSLNQVEPGELSIEQRKHERQNENREYTSMNDRKLDGPNRPAE